MTGAGLADVAPAVLTAPARLGTVRLLVIDGPSGSGKSVLAMDTVTALRRRGATVALVPTDDFATWDDPVAWWPRLADGVLQPLREGRPGRYRRLDWSSGEPRPGEEVTVPVPDVLIIEGVSAGRQSVAGERSLAVWVELPDADRCLAAAVARDGEHCREQLRRWQDFERGWFAIDDTRARSDLVITREHCQAL